MTETIPEVDPKVEGPQPVYNCPECSHYLMPGMLACPDCHALAYGTYLRDLAVQASQQETEKAWGAARQTWVHALQWIPEGTAQHDSVAQRVTAIDSRETAAVEKKARWTKRLGPLAPAVFFLAKAKGYLFLIFKFKFLFSFLAYFGLYWAFFGWKFGLGFALSILLHEMGHYIVARSKGLTVDLPVFIPGMGAYVRWYSQGVTVETLATIALAGPFFGLLVAVACAVMAFVTGNSLAIALAYTTAWINAINLVPVAFFDGGQATHALDRTQRWLVLATSIIFFLMLQNAVFLFVALGMGWRVWKNDVPDKPSSRTLVRFILLLFALGMIIYRFPDPVRHSGGIFGY